MKLKLLSTLILIISSLSASSLSVESPYVRATPPGVPNTAAFMTLKNNIDEDISIMSASSSVAEVLELHTHDMTNGVMSMYQIKKIDVEAKSATVLKPGGYHVMFFGLKNPLKEGQNVDLELTLYNGEKIKFIMPVKKVMSGMSMGH